jgi:hypothetical protein
VKIDDEALQPRTIAPPNANWLAAGSRSAPPVVIDYRNRKFLVARARNLESCGCWIVTVSGRGSSDDVSTTPLICNDVTHSMRMAYGAR